MPLAFPLLAQPESTFLSFSSLSLFNHYWLVPRGVGEGRKRGARSNCKSPTLEEKRGTKKGGIGARGEGGGRAYGQTTGRARLREF